MLSRYQSSARSRVEKIYSFAIAMFVIGLAVSGEAWATPELRAVEPGLADLPLGQNRAALRGWLAGRLAASAGPGAPAELAERARQQAARTAELDRIMGGEVAFGGVRTPWDASILSGEFGHGSGESLIVWQDEGAAHFFFLAGGMLWKYARQLDGTLPLAERALAWQRRLGRSPDADEGGLRRWDTKRLSLGLADRRADHGGDLLLVWDREAAKNLLARRKPLTPERARDPAVDRLDDFLLPAGAD